ncbi:MAG: pbpE 6, partial [Verrucomicrobiaceae bacterium]|nr:pbpE 6 [Verrucomicrobiaceae bacterium]
MRTAFALFAMLAAWQALAFDGVPGIKAVVESAITNHHAPGAAVWIEREGQAEHWVQGLRSATASREDLTEDSLFDVASLTKVVATTPCIMLLIQQGRIALEAPVKTYIAEFTGEGRDAITVRHLLTHVSGMPADLAAKPAWAGYAEGIRLACACVPDPGPGHVFRYSDVNFILLGEIVRRVSGQPLDVYAREQIFKPLKMTDTGFNPDASLSSRIAPTERDENGRMLRGVVHDPSARRMGGVAGHAGLFATIADLARFCRMMLTGELEGVRLFTLDTLKLMTSPQTPSTVFERRGLGWDIDSRFSRARGKAFPLGSFGHTGFTGTALWIDPGSQAFYVFLSSRLHPDGKGDVRDLYEEVGTLAARALKVAGPATIFKRSESEVPTVLNGIDVLKRNGFAQLQGLRVGLITNHTGIDNERNATIDLLAHAQGVRLTALFSPEHGIRGVLDQDKIEDGKDEKSGLPVFSLHGDRTAPTGEQM